MRHDLFEDIIQNIDVDEVPLEFIIMAKVTGHDGTERLLRGPELARVIRGPERKRLVGLNIILDVRKIRTAVISGVNDMCDEINRLCDEQKRVLATKKDTDI